MTTAQYGWPTPTAIEPQPASAQPAATRAPMGSSGEPGARRWSTARKPCGWPGAGRRGSGPAARPWPALRSWSACSAATPASSPACAPVSATCGSARPRRRSRAHAVQRSASSSSASFAARADSARTSSRSSPERSAAAAGVRPGTWKSVCQAAFTAAAVACRARSGAAGESPGSGPVRSSAAAASRARAVAMRSGPRGRNSAGAMHTSQASAPAPRARDRWKGTWPIRCGTKKADAEMKVKIRFPGGPTRVASQTVLCTAATSEASRTSSGTDVVSEAAVRAAPRLATMPSTTHASVRARAAYGRPCAYRAHIAPAEVYRTRSRRPSANRMNSGTPRATTALSAGLCQMSTGRRSRTVLLRGSGRARTARVLPERAAACFPVGLACFPIPEA